LSDPVIETRLLGRFYADSLKTDTVDCVETNRLTLLDRLV